MIKLVVPLLMIPPLELLDRVLGLHPLVFIAFLMLYFIDWITGISAAKSRGEEVLSKKLDRIVVSFVMYASLLAIFHIFSVEYKWPAAFGIEVNFASAVFFGLFSVSSLKQFYSILENRRDIGDKTAKVAIMAIDYFMTGKWGMIWKLIKDKAAKDEAEKKPTE